MFKIWCRFHKWKEKLEKYFRFLDNRIWIGSHKFSQYWTGYLTSAVNVLRNILKIWLNSTGDIFQINFSQNDENTWQKRSHRDFGSIFDNLTCWVSKCFLKQRFLESFLTKIFTVCNFRNTLAMTIIFFVQNIWNLM